jgi:hypothetical protein
MRDKAIHDYFGVNLEIVWAVQKELPKLDAAIVALLAGWSLVTSRLIWKDRLSMGIVILSSVQTSSSDRPSSLYDGDHSDIRGLGTA